MRRVPSIPDRWIRAVSWCFAVPLAAFCLFFSVMHYTITSRFAALFESTAATPTPIQATFFEIGGLGAACIVLALGCIPIAVMLRSTRPLTQLAAPVIGTLAAIAYIVAVNQILLGSIIELMKPHR